MIDSFGIQYVDHWCNLCINFGSQIFFQCLLVPYHRQASIVPTFYRIFDSTVTLVSHVDHGIPIVFLKVEKDRDRDKFASFLMMIRKNEFMIEFENMDKFVLKEECGWNWGGLVMQEIIVPNESNAVTKHRWIWLQIVFWYNLDGMAEYNLDCMEML